MIRLLFGLLAFVLVPLWTTGCAYPEEAAPNAPGTIKEASLTVFAAASLSEAFTEIAGIFEQRRPGVDVVLNLAGSQQLAQQISLGAPADLFASANEAQMQVAIESGRIARDATQSFARNHLVVITPRNNPAALESLRDLARSGLRIVLAAEAVPAGRYSAIFLEKASRTFGAAYRSRVLANVASYEQNVRAVLTKVALGEADAGIVYSSDLSGAGEVFRLDIPDSLNIIAEYPIAPLIDSNDPGLACDFIAFVRGPEGQAILVRYGFISVESR